MCVCVDFIHYYYPHCPRMYGLSQHNIVVVLLTMIAAIDCAGHYKEELLVT